MKIFSQSIPLWFTFFLTACASTKDSGSAGLAARNERSSTASQPESYMRVAGASSNVVQLQIAVRKFVPARGSGPSVWLTGASHIGDSNYFAGLQNHLDAQSLVLFEGVSDRSERNRPKAHHAPQTTEADAADAGKAEAGSLQNSLAESLGLTFQLNGINYDRANFRNSDLSITELQRLMQDSRGGKGEGGAGAEFQQLLQIMDEKSFMGAIAKLVVTFLGSNPKLQAITRLALIETLGEVKGDFSQVKGMPPELQRLVKVLIEARNQAVLDDLKGELKKKNPPRSIAIFYGAGHMEDMEKRLERELKYRPADQFWLTAFSVDLEKAGVTKTELGMIRSFVKWQLEAFGRE